MTAKGHMLLAAPIGAIVLNSTQELYFGYELNTSELMMFYTVLIFGSLLPDIDEPESYIGRRLPIFSNILSIFVEHRGITHLAFIPITIFFVGFYFIEDQYTKIFMYAISIGIIAHDAGDLLTRGGIRGFLFPLMPNHTIGLLPKELRFYTNSVTEYLVMLMLIVLNIYLFIIG